MKISTKLTSLGGAAAGVLMAVVAYQTSSSVAEPVPAGTAPVSTDRAPANPDSTGVADCPPPARLVDGACVTRVERTVVVYDAPARAATGRVSASSDDSPEHEDVYDDNPKDESDLPEHDGHRGDSADRADSVEDEPEHATQEEGDD